MRSVIWVMVSGSSYVLGVDGLPLGASAAAAIDGALRATFALPGPGAALSGVSQRVQAAVAQAEAELGSIPTEVRLVCVDDGGDGSEVALTRHWLAERGIAFRVLDLVGSEGALPLPSIDLTAQDARSLARASEAALW